jgi:hypothetical protein
MRRRRSWKRGSERRGAYSGFTLMLANDLPTERSSSAFSSHSNALSLFPKAREGFHILRWSIFLLRKLGQLIEHLLRLSPAT